MAEPWTQGPVVVTGGTGRIGLAITRAFLAAGAVTVAVGSSAERTEAARQALGGAANAHVRQADMGDIGAAERMLRGVEDEFGPTAVLVNGAGINFNRAIRLVEPAEFDKLIKVNVRAMFFASRFVAERMAEAGIAGRIVNITSGNYRYARPDGALYSATKAAMEMLTRGFALEYGPRGININAVAPGLVEQPETTDPMFLKVAGYYEKNSAQHALVTPQDVADAVMFFASSKARHIAGETLVVDSGFSAGRLDFPQRSS